MSKLHEFSSFFDTFFEQISRAQLDITGLTLDHLAYQASSAEDYDTLKPLFAQLGVEVHEGIIAGRRVSVFELHQPIEYKNYRVPALELIEPRSGQVCESGYQHAEFVVTQPFEWYMEKYPQIEWDTSSLDRAEFAHLKLNFKNGMTLKFLKAPILELVTPVAE